MKKRIVLILAVTLLHSNICAYADNTENTDGENISEEIFYVVEPYNAKNNEEEIRKYNEKAANPLLIYAADSQLMSFDGEIVDMSVSPFVEHDTSYVPFRELVEALGGTVDYDPETQTAAAHYKDNTFVIDLTSDKTRIYLDWSYYPVREVCDGLGVSLNWYSGLFSIRDGDASLSEDEVWHYKSVLNYNGYTDSFFRPRHVVNPYIKYDYDRMNEDIEILSRMYPDLVHDVGSIGTSADGREITSFIFGKGSENIIICASMHAREYISTNVVMNMVDTYALSYAWDETRDGYSFRDTLNKYSFIIIPMVNPDGIALAQYGYDSASDPLYLESLPANSYGFRGWKANINGVDLNNNFDWLWYKKGSGPSYAGYSGPYGGSEPETQAMQRLIDETDFKVFLSLHTQGEVVYWMDPNCDQDLIPLFSPHISRLCNEIGFEKMPSDGSLGYSGYMTDYVRKFKRAMAMTVELCPYIGDYPYPESDFNTVYYPVRNIGLILADIADQL